MPRYFAEIKTELDPSKTLRLFLMSGEVAFHPLAILPVATLQGAYKDYCQRMKISRETWTQVVVKDALAYLQTKRPGVSIAPHDAGGVVENGVTVFKGMDLASSLHQHFEGAGDPWTNTSHARAAADARAAAGGVNMTNMLEM